jgi:general nucleoside transport system permease protein
VIDLETVAKTHKKPPISTRLRRGRWITLAFALFFLLIVWGLLNLVIKGQCDNDCVKFALAQMIRLATPIALAAFCGLISERSGIINIGIEGKMLIAAMVAYAANLFSYQWLLPGIGPEAASSMSRLIGLGAAVMAGLLLGALHAAVSIRFRANQIISGVVINILAVGLTGYLYRQFLAENIPAGPGTFPILKIPILADLPWVGPVLFQQKPLTYLMLLIAILLTYVLSHTPWGLRTRASGEHPQAAAAMGVNVNYTRVINVIAGGALAGLAGAWFTLEAVDVFNPLMTSGLGFIGLAAMIFGNWTAGGALLGSLIFGLGSSLTTTVSIYRPDIPPQLPQMLPYLLTMIVLAGFAGRSAPPAAVGEPYSQQPMPE